MNGGGGHKDDHDGHPEKKAVAKMKMITSAEEFLALVDHTLV